MGRKVRAVGEESDWYFAFSEGAAITPKSERRGRVLMAALELIGEAKLTDFWLS